MTGLWTSLHWGLPQVLACLPFVALWALWALLRAPVALRPAPVWAQPGLWATSAPAAARPAGLRPRHLLRTLQRAAVLALLVLALAQPQRHSPPPEAAPLGRDIALVLDVSASMGLEDPGPETPALTRMQRVQTLLDPWLAGRPHDRFALIVFGQGAAVLTPPTHDIDHVRAQLARLQPGLLGELSAVGDGLALAVRQVRTRHPGLRPAVVFVSDGEWANTGDVQPAEALASALEAGVTLHTLQIGSGPAPQAADDLVEPQPTLADLARLTDGLHHQVARAADASPFLQQLAERTPTLEPPPPPPRLQSLTVWPLAAAGALLVLGLLPGWARAHRALTAVDPALRPWVWRTPPADRHQRIRQALLAAGVLLAALAPWLPAGQGHNTRDTTGASPVQRQGQHISVVVSTGSGMHTPGAGATPLTRARLALQDAMATLRGERISLVAYGASPVWLLPATHDPALLLQALDRLDPVQMPAGDPQPGPALDLARRLHAGDGPGTHAVLWVTDGTPPAGPPARGPDLAQALTQLQAQGTPVWVALVEPPAGSSPEPHRTWARSTAGDAWTLSPGSGTLPSGSWWSDWLTQALPRPVAQPDGVEAQPPHPWPALALALLLAAAAWSPWPLHRGPPPALSTAGATTLLLVAAVLASGAPGTVRAQTPEPPTASWSWQAWGAPQRLHRAAHDAWTRQDWTRARLLYTELGGAAGAEGAGLSALRQGLPGEALPALERAWLLAPDSEARVRTLYNLGHGLAAAGRWAAAAQAWADVLEARPDHDAARHNRALALDIAARQRAAQAPSQDLYGRRGHLAQGRVDTERGGEARELRLDAGQTATGPGRPPAAGDDASRSARTLPAFAPLAAHAQSGRAKVERLREQDRTLWQNLMRQGPPASTAP